MLLSKYYCVLDVFENHLSLRVFIKIKSLRKLVPANISLFNKFVVKLSK